MTPNDFAPLVHLSSDFIRAKEYFEAIVTSISDAVCTTDMQGRIVYFSPGASTMTGLRDIDVMGRYVHRFYAHGRAEAAKIMKTLRRQGSIQNHDMAVKGKDGRLINVSMSASLLRDRSGRVIGTLGIYKDITHRVELERRLRELSITDNLTGLFNQRHFHARLAQEAKRAKRQRYKLSLILMDLDDFKQVNDRHGHLEGDRILRVLADAVEKSIRKEVDSAFRYGGDELVILLPGLSPKRAEKVAERIALRAGAVVPADRLRFSYGVAALSPSASPSDLVRAADRRMYKMKSRHKQEPAASALPFTDQGKV